MSETWKFAVKFFFRLPHYRIFYIFSIFRPRFTRYSSPICELSRYNITLLYNRHFTSFYWNNFAPASSIKSPIYIAEGEGGEGDVTNTERTKAREGKKMYRKYDCCTVYMNTVFREWSGGITGRGGRGEKNDAKEKLWWFHFRRGCESHPATVSRGNANKSDDNQNGCLRTLSRRRAGGKEGDERCAI